MQRLSSSMTGFYKRGFPALWFGILFLVLVATAWGWLRPQAGSGRPDAMLVAMPLLMGGFGYVLFRRLVFDLMDEVWRDGDWLVVKNRGEQARVSLRDVVNVNASTLTNPRRVTLLLRTPSRFGRRFSFMPASPRGLFTAFRPDPVAEALIERIDALRGIGR